VTFKANNKMMQYAVIAILILAIIATILSVYLINKRNTDTRSDAGTDNPTGVPVVATTYYMWFPSPNTDVGGLNSPETWIYDPPTNIGGSQDELNWKTNMQDLANSHFNGVFLVSYQRNGTFSDSLRHTKVGTDTILKNRIPMKVGWFGTYDQPDWQTATIDKAFNDFYTLNIKPFYAQTPKGLWMTHNNFAVEKGGRPILNLWAIRRIAEYGVPLITKLKQQFKTDFGVDPFILAENEVYKSFPNQQLLDGVYGWNSPYGGRRDHQHAGYSTTSLGLGNNEQLIRPWRCNGSNPDEPGLKNYKSRLEDGDAAGYFKYQVRGAPASANLVFIQDSNELNEGAGFVRALNYPAVDNPVISYCADGYVMGEPITTVRARYNARDNKKYLPQDHYLNVIRGEIASRYPTAANYDPPIPAFTEGLTVDCKDLKILNSSGTSVNSVKKGQTYTLSVSSSVDPSKLQGTRFAYEPTGKGYVALKPNAGSVYNDFTTNTATFTVPTDFSGNTMNLAAATIFKIDPAGTLASRVSNLDGDNSNSVIACMDDNQFYYRSNGSYALGSAQLASQMQFKCTVQNASCRKQGIAVAEADPAPSLSPTVSPTPSASPVPSATPILSPTPSPTPAILAASPTASPSVTTSTTITPSISPTLTSTPSASVTVTQTVTPTNVQLTPSVSTNPQVLQLPPAGIFYSTTPTFTGTTTASTDVNVYLNTTSNLVGSTTSNASGNWSVTSTSLTPGEHQLYVEVVQVEGNQMNGPFGFTVSDSVLPDTGAGSLQTVFSGFIFGILLTLFVALRVHNRLNWQEKVMQVIDRTNSK
jgi:Bacterial Ig-like domain